MELYIFQVLDSVVTVILESACGVDDLVSENFHL